MLYLLVPCIWYLTLIQCFCSIGNFCWVWRSMARETGETSLGILWPRGHQLKSQVMLRSISLGSFQEGRIRGDQVSMISQWSISKTQNCLHQTVTVLLLRNIWWRLQINRKIIICPAWLSKNLTGNHQTRACHLFLIQLKETCLWHRRAGFLHTNRNRRGVMCSEALIMDTSFHLLILYCKCNLCSINELRRT